ncbi:MAG: two-component system, OmpR family, sensor kinase, partial [Actinomycetota bacterium]|nr:two-component system, OmpR family, sensor kinase [Actinomycetota bacterium]
MTSLRSPSLSLRLVALYGMLVAAALLVVAGAVMYLTRAHLTHQLDAGLRRTTASFAEGPALSVGSARDLEGAAREWLKVLPLPAGQLVEIRTSQPPRVLSIGGALDLEDFPGGPELLNATTPGWHRIGDEDPRLRVLAVPLSVGGRQIGTLVAAASERDVVSTLSALQRGIAAASGAALFLAALLGFFTVRRTLRPLAQISAEAQAIQETGDLQRRVAHAGPADEVGRLAEVFDRMLDKLQESFASQQRFLADASHELRTPMTVIR